MQEGVLIPASTIFYVRALISHGMAALKDKIELHEQMGSNPSIPGVFRGQFKGMVPYERQMLRESREAVEKLPEELRCVLVGVDGKERFVPRDRPNEYDRLEAEIDEGMAYQIEKIVAQRLIEERGKEALRPPTDDDAPPNEEPPTT